MKPVPLRAGSVAALSLGAYLWLGITQYVRGRSGSYDLGIFTQAAKGWLTEGAPISPIKGGSLFADHFSPITIVFAAAYAGWSDPRALIVAQSLSLAGAVLLVGVHAARALPANRAVIVAGCLAAGLPLLAAARFDVHETALGATLFAGFFLAWRSGRLGPTLAWAVALLTVKEDVGPILVMAGVAWWLHRRDARAALALAGVGLAGFALATLVVAAHADAVSPYTGYLFSGWTWDIGRLRPALLFLAMTGLTWRDPMMLMALPTLGWRFLAAAPNYWSVSYHYDVPLAVLAAVILTERLRSGRSRAALLAAAVPVGLGVALVLSLTPWRATPFQTPYAAPQVAALAERIPAGATVLADQMLGVHLIRDYDVRMLTTTDRPGTLHLTPPTAARWVMLAPDRHTWGAPVCAKEHWLASVDYPRWRAGIALLVDQGRPLVPDLPPCER